MGTDSDVLQMRVDARSKYAQKPDVGGAAAQEYVLAVVHLPAGFRIREGERPAAQEGPLLQEHYRVAAVGEVAGG